MLITCVSREALTHHITLLTTSPSQEEVEPIVPPDWHKVSRVEQPWISQTNDTMLFLVYDADGDPGWPPKVGHWT